MGRSGRKRGRRDKIAVGSDIRQHSRFIGAVARSRRKEQSLEGMRRREQNNSEFTMQNAQFIILSGANRRTQRAQRPLADYASQEGERQTKSVKNLSTYTFIQILCRSSDLLRMTMLLFRIGFGTECPPRFSPGPAAGVASSMRAGPGHKAKDLEMPITCTLFENSAADWNMQLAATQVGNRNCFPVGW